MTERARFAAIVAVLAVTLGVAIAVTVNRVESELLARSQLALAAAGIPFYDIAIDGRDALLRGFVASGDQERRIIDVVAAVPGVRAVNSEIVVERIAESNVRAAAGAPPTLRIQRVGATVRVDGVLANAARAAALLDALRAELPGTSIVGGIRPSSAVDDAAWGHDSQLLARLVARAGEDLRLLVRGGTAILSATVRDATDAEVLREVALSLPDLTWHFELNARDGTLSGSGGRP